MKKYLLILSVLFAGLAPAKSLQIPLSEMDEAYKIEDYTIPSFTQFLIAKEAAKANPTDANMEALYQKVDELKPYQSPYTVVANINGDPTTRMAFAWLTNDRMLEGQVQLTPVTDITSLSTAFDAAEDVITVTATSTATKKIRYAIGLSGIPTATGLSQSTKYKYTSHKAIAENLTPNTTYAYRVGTDGYWSEVASFTTAPENKVDESEEFTFIYMTDSHIENQTYIDDARSAATAAVANVPEAKFCVFPGDFVETGGNGNAEWEWERWFEEALTPVIKQMPIVPTDGNHDDSSNQNYSFHFNTNNSFKENAQTKPQFDGITYSFMYGDVLFLVFSMQDYWKGSPNMSDLTCSYLTNDVGNWFRNQVARHPEAKLRVALVHKNIFSGSSHQEDDETPLFRATMLPIMKECEIDLVMQGHDHCYEVMGPVDPDTRTPILDAITDREEVPTNVSMSGYKGGTYLVDDGTLYFIGSTCGHKRYWPNSKATMDSYYELHKVDNYFDLFTGMFVQPDKPSYSAFSVKDKTITVNSYIVDEEGNSTLFNTFKVVREKEHTPLTGLEDIHVEQLPTGDVTTKLLYQGQIILMRNGIAYDVLGNILQ
jgi:hypothetical protein